MDINARGKKESFAAYKKRRARIQQDTKDFLKGRYVTKNSGPNRVEQAIASANALDKTNKCGKRKKIHEPGRVDKRFNAMMEGRSFYFKFFQKAGITLHM